MECAKKFSACQKKNTTPKSTVPKRPPARRKARVTGKPKRV